MAVSLALNRGFVSDRMVNPVNDVEKACMLGAGLGKIHLKSILDKIQKIHPPVS